MIYYKEIGDEDRKKVCSIISESWGSCRIVTKGKVHDAHNLPGYMAMENQDIKGLITYCIENGECEITSLESFLENAGIGSTLIEKVIEKAKASGCDRVWLITTNDNTKAIRYYQRRGFNLAAVHIDAIKKSRELKPEIPFYGFDGIPILHEFEFEKRL